LSGAGLWWQQMHMIGPGSQSHISASHTHTSITRARLENSIRRRPDCSWKGNVVIAWCHADVCKTKMLLHLDTTILANACTSVFTVQHVLCLKARICSMSCSPSRKACSTDTCHLYTDSAVQSWRFQAAIGLPVWLNRMTHPRRRQGYRWLSQCTDTPPCTASGMGFRP